MLSLIWREGQSTSSERAQSRRGTACLVGDGLGVRPPLGDNPHGGGASTNGRAGEAEGVHGELRG